MKYLKKFLTQTEYQAYRNSADFVFPNASYIVEKTDELKERANVTGTPKLNLKFKLDPYYGLMGFAYPKGAIQSMIIDGTQIEITPEEYKTTETLLYGSEMTLDMENMTATFPDSYVLTNTVDKVELKLQDSNLKVNDITAFVLLGVAESEKLFIPMLISDAIAEGLIEVDTVNNVIRLTDMFIAEINMIISTYGIYYGFVLGDIINESYDMTIYDTKRVVTGIIGGLPSPYIIHGVDEADVTLYLNTDHIAQAWEFASLNSVHGEHITSIEDLVFANLHLNTVSFSKHLKSIGNGTFGNCSGLTSIVIPNSVTSIGSQAFYQCSGLTSIVIPNSVTSIGNQAFSGCSGLTSVTLGSGVTTIGDRVFSNCSGLVSIDIPDSVTSIGFYTFGNCSGLTSIVIPNGVTSIGNQAFSGCSGLTSVTLGSGVTTIDGYAFYGCSKLISIDIPSSVTSIGEQGLPFYSLLTINCHGNVAPTMTLPPTTPGGIVYIPEGSDYDSWKNNNSFKTWKFVTKGSNDKYVAVRYDRSSEEMDLCQNTDWFDTMIIKGTTYTTPVTTYTNTASTTTVLYHLVKPEISDNAFNFAYTMTAIHIPDSVTYIGNNAFRRCNSLTSIDIPSSVTSIGDQAFYECSGLTSIDIPDAVTTINERTFASCDKLEYVSLGSKVRTIKDHAFSNSYALNSIEFPSTLKTIGRNAFWQTKLEDVRIPDSVTSIGTECFAGNSSLKSITIGSRVTSIGKLPFYYNTNLKEIICYAKKAPEAGGFIEVARNGILYVPQGSDYSSWMKNEEYYLGYYDWTISYI